jgi:hypothetical protein
MAEQHEQPGERAVHQMMVAMTGAGASEHDVEPPGASTRSVQVGHEPDQFQVKAILYVPLVVVITLVLTYVLVTVMFGPLTAKSDTPPDKPQVAQLNDAPFNDRVGRYSSTAPKPVHDQPDTVVPQPRLEGFQQQAKEHEADADFYRSKLPLPGGGPRTIRPEDLRAENFLDPTYQRKLLAEHSWVGEDKKFARLPIGDAIKLMVEKKKLAARKDPVKLADTSADAPKLSNGGQGPPPRPTPAAGADHKDKEKKDHK